MAGGPPYVVGVHIGVTVLGVGLVNLRSQTVALDLTDMPKDGAGSSLLDRVAESIRRIARKRRCSLKRDILGIGVGIGGIVDADSGTLVWHESKDLRNLPVKRILEERLGIPVFVGNIVQALALGEAQFGLGKTLENFVYLYVGGIVGCAFINRGEVLAGARNIAGQISHMIMKSDGPTCACGRQGCLEVLVSRKAVLRRVQLALAGKRLPPGQRGPRGNSKGLAMEELVQAARAGDAETREILEDRGTYLGKIIADLVNLLDPQRVIVGFGLPASRPATRQLWDGQNTPDILLSKGNEFISEFESRTLEKSFFQYLCSPENNPPVLGCRVGREMQVAGSASLAIKNVLSPMLSLIRSSAEVTMVPTLKER